MSGGDEFVPLLRSDYHSLATALYTLESDIANINRTNGWYDINRTFSADIALLHSEVSEAFEAYRKDHWLRNSDDKRDTVEDELADVLIRLLDTCYRHKINLAGMVLDKLKYNASRGYRHGNKLV